MSDAMQLLFNHATEKRVLAYLPARYADGMEEQEDALTATMTGAQLILWDRLQETRLRCDLVYEQALFQAAWELAKETP